MRACGRLTPLGYYGQMTTAVHDLSTPPLGDLRPNTENDGKKTIAAAATCPTQLWLPESVVEEWTHTTIGFPHPKPVTRWPQYAPNDMKAQEIR